MKPIYLLALFCTLTLFTNALFSQSVAPIVANGYCKFEIGNVFFEAAAPHGGRVYSFKIDNQEILFNDSTYGDDFLWGSVLWPSPQTWPWPPSQTLDSKEYTLDVKDNRCRMTSAISTSMGMRFIKDYYAAIEDTSITIVYKIVNETTATKHNAAWEVTRVPPSGLFFYPTGDESATSGLSEYVQEISEHSWYQNQESDNGGQKFFADGAQGWYAHVNAGKQVFIKQFDDVSNSGHAPNENEIELWLNGDKAYMELENQGVYADIAAGETLKYVVKWYLRNLPENISVEAGNLALVDFVNSTLSDGVTDPDTTTTSISKQLAITKGISLSPNPASHYIYVNNADNNEYTAEVYSISGQLLLKNQVEINGGIDIGQLNSGIYLMKLKSAKSTVSLRFIKQ